MGIQFAEDAGSTGHPPGDVTSRRISWAELPRPVRSWVAATMGSKVVHAATQQRGFSPGAASRLLLADGRRVFVKAVSGAVNADSMAMHQREARITGALPAGIAAPQLLGHYAEQDWAALILSDVDGRPPARPWPKSELRQVLRALNDVHEQLTPPPSVSAPRLVDSYAASFRGWHRIADEARVAIDPWFRRHLDRIVALEDAWPAAADGVTLLHSDLRADNMLITDNNVVFVDWPWACIGAAWVDTVMLAPSVVVDGGPDPEWLLRQVPSVDSADHDEITAVVAAVSGYFTWQAAQPGPPGLPRLRAFQHAQGHAARTWLRQRTGWR